MKYPLVLAMLLLFTCLFIKAYLDYRDPGLKGLLENVGFASLATIFAAILFYVLKEYIKS